MIKELSVDTFNDLFSMGLYIKMKLPKGESLLELVTEKFAIKMYCPYCNDFSIFKFSKCNIDEVDKDKALRLKISNAKAMAGSTGMSEFNDCTKSLLKHLVLECACDTTHNLRYYFVTEDDLIIKVGQYPSIAEIQFPQLNKYNNLLKEYSSEFKRSLGLFSHGIGIGSFIYLRRIFEFVIENVHNQVKTKEGWNEEEYKNLHLEDKIKACEKFYPVFPEALNKYKMQIYGILSKAVHCLEEEECLKLYPAVQYVIERILDNEIEKKQKVFKLKEALDKLPPVK